MFVLIFTAYLSLGTVTIPIDDLLRLLISLVINGTELTQEKYPLASAIVVHIRLPRACAAIFAGAALALAGACTQGLFRNPLASPDILGVSAGSSFGAVLGIVSGLAAYHPLFIPLCATVGALTTAMLVYLLASRTAHDQTLYVILSGLALTSLIGGATMGVLLFAKQYQVSQFVFWTMGGLEGRMWQHIIWPLPAILIVGFLALKHWRWLDILALGEQSAHGVGLNVKRSQILLLIAATILTAMAIAIAGPIGFIGLMVPHLVRMLVGPTHRILLPYSMLFGALFLLLCDLFGRWAISPFEIKAGVITSVVGGLYFVFLIINIQRKGRIL